MKKYLHIGTVLAAAVLLFSCAKETVNPYEQVSVLSVKAIDSQFEYGPEATTGVIVLDTEASITAASDRPWCTPSVSGNKITLTLDANAGKLNRYAQITVKSSDASVDVSIVQYGEILAGLSSLSDVTASVDGEVVTIPVKLNVGVTFDTDADWIHPEVGTGELVITIDPNPDPLTRSGIVYYTAGSEKGSFEVTQYPELKRNDDWAVAYNGVSYVYPAYIAETAFTTGATDMYVSYMVPKSVVGDNVEDYIFSTMAVSARRDILNQMEAAGGSFADYLNKGPQSISMEGVTPGENYLIAVGFADNSYVTGLYQYVSVTIDDVRPTYYKWAGTWIISGPNGQNPHVSSTSYAFTAPDYWTIEIDEEKLEKELIVHGMNSIETETVVKADGATMRFTYNEDGSISLKSQQGNHFDYSSYGDSYMQPQGLYTKNGSSGTRVSAMGVEIFRLSMDADGKVTVTPGIRTSGGVDYPYIGFRLYLVAGNGSTYSLGATSGTIPIPFEIARQ